MAAIKDDSSGNGYTHPKDGALLEVDTRPFPFSRYTKTSS